MCSGLMPPLLRALICHSKKYLAFLLHKHLVRMAQLSLPSSGYLVIVTTFPLFALILSIVFTLLIRSCLHMFSFVNVCF